VYLRFETSYPAAGLRGAGIRLYTDVQGRG